MTILSKYHGALIALATTGDARVRQALLRSLDPKVIQLLAQIAANVINGNIAVTESQRKRLSHYKRVLRKLRDNKSYISRRKALIKQKRGFLPFLIPLAAGTLGGMLGKVFN